MKKYIKITPEGSQDYLFEECTAYTDVYNKITNVFESRGFHLVITPALEFYDLFSMPCSGIAQETMFKTTDNKGRLIAVRPDSTLPIARMVSTRLKKENSPIRLYYRQAVYRNNPALTGKANEIMQMGIELLGAKGKRADLEVITTAIDSLKSIVPDFRIELGHAGFYNALANQINADDELKEEIRVNIEGKNYAALNNILESLDNTPAVNAMRKLPRLFGGQEVFEKAFALNAGKEAQDALHYLKDLYNTLSALGLGDKLIVDLGLVQRNDYYSGVVFTGYVQGSGDEVLSGGRYDTLLDKFDEPMGAAGFAADIDALAKINLTKNKFTTCAPSILVYADDGYEIQGIKHAIKLTSMGKKAEFCVLTGREEAEKYAAQKGINEIFYIDAGGAS